MMILVIITANLTPFHIKQTLHCTALHWGTMHNNYSHNNTDLLVFHSFLTRRSEWIDCQSEEENRVNINAGRGRGDISPDPGTTVYRRFVFVCVTSSFLFVVFLLFLAWDSSGRV